MVALMKLEAEAPGRKLVILTTQENNEWRGGWVSPYAANIQWDVYQNSDSQVLVRRCSTTRRKWCSRPGVNRSRLAATSYDFAELGSAATPTLVKTALVSWCAGTVMHALRWSVFSWCDSGDVWSCIGL